MSESLCPLSVVGLRHPPTMPKTAEAPKLRWLEIDLLAVDFEYQRSLDRNSLRRIEKIAAEFDWRWFGAAVVAAAGELFAIIDGQHRTAAAKLLGYPAVPCLVVVADRREQARAFVAMNNTGSRVHGLQVHRAALAAGDAKAAQIEQVASAAGVALLRNPRTMARRKPNETMAISAIGRAIARHGEPATQRALKALTSHSPAIAGLLDRDWIFTLAELIAEGWDEAQLRGRDVAKLDASAIRDAAAAGGRKATFLRAALRGERVVAPPRLAPAPRDASNGRVIDWRPDGGVIASAFGDPPPGRSALDQRKAGL